MSTKSKHIPWNGIVVLAILGVLVVSAKLVPDAGTLSGLETPSPKAEIEMVEEDFEMMRFALERFTDAQWEIYKDYVKGKKVIWSGYVADVSASGSRAKVLIDMDDPSSFSIQDIYLEGVPVDRALDLMKGQKVEFEGIIKSIYGMGTSLQISLDSARIRD